MSSSSSNYSCYSSHNWYPSTVPKYDLDDVAEEVASLPIEEQQRALKDVNGSEEPIIEETIELIDSSIEELNEELDLIENKEEYDLAQITCPDYVNSQKFKLMFLRADQFNAKAAANRIVQHWSDKVDLFGVEKALRGRLTIHDLTEEDDQAAMLCEGVTLLPVKDTYGRAIVFIERSRFLHGDNPLCCSDGMVRFLWYLIQSSLEDDDEVQRNGIVWISIATPSINAQDRKIITKMIKHGKRSIPMRFAAVHHIVPTDIKLTRQNNSNSNTLLSSEAQHLMNLCISYFLFIIGKPLRARYRQHKVNLSSPEGSSTTNNKAEFFLTLNSYGITKEMLPKDIGGELDDNYYQSWLEESRSREMT